MWCGLSCCTPCLLLFKSSLIMYGQLYIIAYRYCYIWHSLCTQMCTCATIPSGSRNRCIRRCIYHVLMIVHTCSNIVSTITPVRIQVHAWIHNTALHSVLPHHTTPHHTTPHHTIPCHINHCMVCIVFTYSYRSIHILYSFLGLPSVAWVSACMFIIR